MQKLIIVSGYFNPIHKGHIEYFQNAKLQGDVLCVIVNSDLQRELKGSKPFISEEERVFIVKNIKGVDITFLSSDQDRTVCNSLREIAAIFKDKYEIFFANGGDQNNDTIPERPVC